MNNDQLESSIAFSIAQGKAGENFVLEFERKRLPKHLRNNIVHLGEFEVARGYDILSYETPDALQPDRCIEVKTFRGHPHFHWTDNEIAAARSNAEHYYLYLVDYDRIGEPNYEPTIIPNPAILFDKGSQWAHYEQQYVFTLKSNEHIPDDWNDSTILIGCYNNEEHLKWIVSHNLYNVRSQKNAPGAVNVKNPVVRQAKYLILYSIANPLVYMIYTIETPPYTITQAEMLAMGYPEPHALYYLLHHITKQIDGFYIDLRSILREVNHTKDRNPGTPVYLNGTQLRRFMACENIYQSQVEHEEIKQPQKSKLQDPEYIKEQRTIYKNAFEPWTPELDKRLLELYNSGSTVEELMEIFQRNHNAITSRIKKLTQPND